MNIPLFIHADILPLSFLYFKSVCCLMHDIRNRKVHSNILNLFSDTTGILSFYTRSSSANTFYIKKSRLEIQNKAFSRVGAKIWREKVWFFAQEKYWCTNLELSGGLQILLASRRQFNNPFRGRKRNLRSFSYTTTTWRYFLWYDDKRETKSVFCIRLPVFTPSLCWWQARTAQKGPEWHQTSHDSY